MTEKQIKGVILSDKEVNQLLNEQERNNGDSRDE